MGMSINMKVTPNWSTPMGQCTYPAYRELNPRLAHLLKQKKAQGNKHKNKKAWPNKGGQQWESEFDLFTHPEPEIRELAVFCDQAVRFMVRATATEPVPADSNIATVYEAWFHVTGYGGIPERARSRLLCLVRGVLRAGGRCRSHDRAL